MSRPVSDRIAWHYYVQKQNQEEIATNLNLSHQSVQRYLSQALEQGIVVTRIDYRYLSECMELGQELYLMFVGFDSPQTPTPVAFFP